MTLLVMAVALASPAADHEQRSHQAPAPESLEAYLNNARALLANRSVKDATALLQQAVERYPTSAEAHLLLGSALALAPRRSEAIAELNRAVELAPDSASAHDALGTALARFAEFERARVAFETAIRLDPHLLDARVNLALVLAERNETAPATTEIARALQMCGTCPNAAYLHYLDGRILMSEELPDRAAAAFESAIHLRPDYGEAYLELGSAKQKLLDDAGALRALRKAVDFAPNNAEARYQLGTEYLIRSRPGEALEQLRYAFQLKPDDRGIIYNFARALRACGQVGQSDVLLRKLAADLKSSSRASERLMETSTLNDQGVQLEKLGQISLAVAKYRAALKIDPLAGKIRRNLGLALCRLGRWDEGVAELREVLRLDPDDAETTRTLYIALDRATAAGH